MANKNSTLPSSGAQLQKRPPIVVVLGHVDHGKTTLISKIYERDLTKKEFGGISQHIGAYQIVYQGKKITFIDTPGHVAFSKMRSRGANVADLAVLVVAADEGVKPQTLESLKYIQEAKIPFLVAANKIDLPNVNLEWLKSNLAENGILVEGWGGNVVLVPVSARTGKGVDELLEMIVLLWEMEEVKTNIGNLEAVVIESRLDSKRGPLATVLVRDGVLRLGDTIRAEDVGGKIRAMINDRGKNVDIVYPGEAVEILGFSKIPPVGAKIIFGSPKEEFPVSSPGRKFPKEEENEEKKVKILLKADAQGTLEAVLASLPEEIKVIFSGVGNINESDILLAKASGAQIVGFNVGASGAVKKLAEIEEVRIKTYNIIYELLKDLEEMVLKILKSTVVNEVILGRAKIIAEFIVNNQRIAGCKVEEGEIDRRRPLHLQRDGKIIGDCQIVSLRVGRTDAEKVKKGEEFGVILSNIDFKIGDMLLSFSAAPLNGEN